MRTAYITLYSSHVDIRFKKTGKDDVHIKLYGHVTVNKEIILLINNGYNIKLNVGNEKEKSSW